MSIQAVAWVLDHSESRGFARLVLISLANRYNKDTGACFPSQRTIAREAGIAVGSIPAQIAKLVELGEVVVEEAGGPRRSARYSLPFAERSGAEHKNAQELSAARGPGLSAARGPGLSGTVSNRNEPRESAASLPDDFAPTDEHRDYAANHDLDLDNELEKFKLNTREKGTTSKDWRATFLRWLHRGAEHQAKNPPPSTAVDVTETGGSRPVGPYACPLELGCDNGWHDASDGVTRCECLAEQVPA